MPNFARTAIMLAALGVTLSACIDAAPAPELANASRRTLTPKEQTLIARDVSMQLKDPDSAKFIWAPLVEAHRRGVIDYCGEVNSKNSYGGYAGFAPFYAQLSTGSDGKISGVDLRLISEPGDEVSANSTATVCSHFGYSDLSG